MPRLLYLLALCNLVIGTGAFVVSGILNLVSEGLQVSVASAGQTMTAFALSTAVLAPIGMMLTARWPRRSTMLLSLLIVAAGSLLCGLAVHFGWMLAGRALMGLGGMFTPLAAGIAVAMVAPDQRGRALSVVVVGMSLSHVIGLPLGAWIAFRFGWQWPFLVVAAGCLLMAIALARAMPTSVSAPAASFAGLAGLAREKAVWWALSMTFIYFTSLFMVFSYLGPLLQALYPMTTQRLSATLLLMGVAGVIGAISGGWATDRFGVKRTLATQLAIIALSMMALPLTQDRYGPMLLVLVCWNIAGFGMMTPQQSRLAAICPGQASLLFSLNTSMLYIGTATGAALGGLFASWFGMVHLSWMSVPFALAALAILWAGERPRPALSPA